jgi:hypothetical protein
MSRLFYFHEPGGRCPFECSMTVRTSRVFECQLTFERILFHVKQHFVLRIRSFLLDRTWSESASAIVGVSTLCAIVGASTFCSIVDMPTCRSNEVRAQEMDLCFRVAQERLVTKFV